MGLDIRTTEFLLVARQLGVQFQRTLTLGRQTVKLIPSDLKKVKAWSGIDLSKEQFADSFFSALGAITIDSMDASSYEAATIIHNLNHPIPPTLHGAFDCVIDGGTLEHIFDFPRAYGDCLKMVKVGGHLIICNMANNCMGHGFYQFSPELFYSTLNTANGFEIKKVLIYSDDGWFEARNPSAIRDRVQAQTRGETFIFVLATKIEQVELFATPPHQSDYLPLVSDELTDDAPFTPPTFRQKIAKSLPIVVKIRNLLVHFKKKTLFTICPLFAEWEARYRHQKYVLSCSLKNRRKFNFLGKRIFEKS